MNPVAPASSDNSQCSLLRSAAQFKLTATVQRGNQALNGLYLQTPSFTSAVFSPLLVSGAANGGRYVQTNAINPYATIFPPTVHDFMLTSILILRLNLQPSIASVTSSGTCTAAGLALYNSNTEQNFVSLVPNIATASTANIATAVSYVFPFQTYTFGSFYACAASGGATLRWIQNNGT